MTGKIIYDRFTVNLIRTTNRAVWLEYEGDEQWIPLAALSMMSEREVTDASPGDSLELFIAEWKAKELGWC